MKIQYLTIIHGNWAGGIQIQYLTIIYGNWAGGASYETSDSYFIGLVLVDLDI